MSRGTQDTASLSAPFAYRTITFYGGAFHPLRLNARILLTRSYNPQHSFECRVWANPLSLAATQGISLDFSSSGY